MLHSPLNPAGIPSELHNRKRKDSSLTQVMEDFAAFRIRTGLNHSVSADSHVRFCHCAGKRDNVASRLISLSPEVHRFRGQYSSR